MAKVLIVDDSLMMCEAISRILSDTEFEVFSTNKGGNVISISKLWRPDVILLDIVLPDTDGYQVCRALKQDPVLSEIPVIFITGITDEEGVIEGFKAGGSDYVSKPFRSMELLARVRAHVKNKSMTDLIVAANNELARVNSKLLEANVRLGEMLNEKRLWAITDSLTGLYNRHFFSENIEEWQREATGGEQYNIILFDIDNFKSINDKYGHYAGDLLLQAVAAIMLEYSYSNMVIRWGGEEFLVVLPKSTTEVAIELANRIRQAVQEYSFNLDGVLLKCTVTAGVTMIRPELSPYMNINRADSALYTGKSQGKNRVVYF